MSIIVQTISADNQRNEDVFYDASSWRLVEYGKDELLLHVFNADEKDIATYRTWDSVVKRVAIPPVEDVQTVNECGSLNEYDSTIFDELVHLIMANADISRAYAADVAYALYHDVTLLERIVDGD